MVVPVNPQHEKDIATWFWGVVDRADLRMKCSFTAEGQFQCVICGKLDVKFRGPIRKVWIKGKGSGYAHAECC